MLIPIYISTHSVLRFPSLHILANICDFWPLSVCFGNLVDLQCYSRFQACSTGIRQSVCYAVLTTIVMLTGVRRYLPVALVFISLVISDVGHFFIFSLVICTSLFKKCLLGSFAYFKNQVICSKGNEIRISGRYLDSHIYCSVIHSGQDMETS